MDPYSEISRIAPYLNTLEPDTNATITYSLVCDGLVWSDELPSASFGDDIMLRYLIMYRTSLIVGNEKKDLRPYWDSAKKAFPDWPGFNIQRCLPNAELALTHTKHKQAELIAFNSAFED